MVTSRSVASARADGPSLVRSSGAIRPVRASGETDTAPQVAAFDGSRLKTILLALSGEHLTRKKLDLLARLAGPLDAGVIAFHVRECLLGEGGEWLLGSDSAFDEGRATAKRILNDVVRPLVSAGIQARGVEAVGRPGEVGRIIVDTAAAEHAGLIIVGSRRRSLMSELFLGGVVRKVRRFSSVPVLVIPTGQRSTRTVVNDPRMHQGA